MKIEVDAEQLKSGGLEIAVRGYEGSPTDALPAPSQIYLENYEGKVQVHVWTGETEDPTATFVLKPLPVDSANKSTETEGTYLRSE